MRRESRQVVQHGRLRSRTASQLTSIEHDTHPLSGKAVAYLLCGAATVQFVWCYLSLTQAYVTTTAYEQGLGRMPFQGRCLMMLPLRLVHHSAMLMKLGASLQLSHFWFPRFLAPEVLVQALIDVLSVATAGVMTARLYQASSQRQMLTVLVYPLVIVACCVTYVMHTVQNFRFLYDLPSLAFFSIAFYLIYTRKSLVAFCLLFIVAMVNRETILLLLPLLLLDRLFLQPEGPAVREHRSTILAVSLLSLLWVAWQLFIRHAFASNASEFYPRLDWNLKSLFLPQAWPQMLSACGYLLVIVAIWNRKVPDPRLRAWLLLVPLWFLFMFSFGILIETRIFGELIPLVVCAASLILEEEVASRFSSNASPSSRRAVSAHLRLGHSRPKATV